MTIFIAAEAGTAHRGDLGQAVRLINAGSMAGADAVKFQCFTEPFWDENDPNLELFASCLWPKSHWHNLFKYANEQGVEVFTSVFDLGAVELMQSLGVKRWKIASRSWQNTGLIDRVVATGDPVYISTGMGDPDIACPDAENITWVHCKSLYPCPDDRVGLNEDGMGLHGVGYSSHCAGSPADCLAAAALGAVYIERHLAIGGGSHGHPDLCCSSNPGSFAQMVKDIRRIEEMIR